MERKSKPRRQTLYFVTKQGLGIYKRNPLKPVNNNKLSGLRICQDLAGNFCHIIGMNGFTLKFESDLIKATDKVYFGRWQHPLSYNANFIIISTFYNELTFIYYPGFMPEPSTEIDFVSNEIKKGL
jgi:hypothetical protein